MGITVDRAFKVPNWDSIVKQKAIDFWIQRGATFKDTSGNSLVGKRGNWWGNATSFDMAKLITRVSITVSFQNDLHCITEINTTGQILTKMNRAYWDLELDTFRSYILNGDMQIDLWNKYKKDSKQSALSWIFSAGQSEREDANSKPLKWYEWTLCGLFPFFFIILGGMLGAVVGILAGWLCYRIFKSTLKGYLKWILSCLTMVMAAILLLILAAIANVFISTAFKSCK
ncbi:MAG: hypothetical protein ACYDHZ_02640 [Dehalococcoidia bacterium]